MCEGFVTDFKIQSMIACIPVNLTCLALGVAFNGVDWSLFRALDDNQIPDIHRLDTPWQPNLEEVSWESVRARGPVYELPVRFSHS